MDRSTPRPITITADLTGYESEIKLADISGDVLTQGYQFWDMEARWAGETSRAVPINGGLLTCFHSVGGAGNQKVTIGPKTGYEMGGQVLRVEPELDLAFVKPDMPLNLPGGEATLDPEFPATHDLEALTLKTSGLTLRLTSWWALDVFVELEPNDRLIPGDSGSPIYDQDGYLVGVLLSRHSESRKLLAAGVQSIRKALGLPSTIP